MPAPITAIVVILAVTDYSHNVGSHMSWPVSLHKAEIYIATSLCPKHVIKASASSYWLVAENVAIYRIF